MGAGRRWWRTRAFLVAGALVLLLAVSGWAALQLLGRGAFGHRLGGGAVTPVPIGAPAPASLRAALAQRQSARALGAGGVEGDHREEEQILFGDLHVHTTFSFDAYMVSLPMFQGEGAHPPADACDFARYCSDLDFWSINDHAEGLTPAQWSETKRVVRQCQAQAGDPASPDLVSFLGWEWTQIGNSPETHYGHKNVILRDLEDERVPARPISSRAALIPEAGGGMQIGPLLRGLLAATAPGGGGRQPYSDFARFVQDRDELARCAAGVPERALPADCQEGAATPAALYDKLDDWGFPYLVIPHGNSWGFYTPPGTRWDKQLRAHADPDRREFLFEVFSGHGSSEVYRPWRAALRDESGEPRCPEPTRDYLPSCWRAGEIVRARCEAAGEDASLCEQRERDARRNYLRAGTVGQVTVPGAKVEDWLDSGQCRDCYMPAFNYRPMGSAQYALAIGDFDAPRPDGRPKRFHFGFLASSDNHTARPGTGYKEVDRREMTESGLAGFGSFASGLSGPEPRSIPLEEARLPMPEFERFASFFGTGGLVAVHSEGRSREAIWRALEQRRVYGTSGDRMLLWFELTNGPKGSAPMGSLVQGAQTPRFRVRAACARRARCGRSRAVPSAAPRHSARSGCRRSVAASVTTRATSAGPSRVSRSCASGRSSGAAKRSRS